MKTAILAVLGVASILFGIVGYSMHPPIAVDPRLLTAEQARAIVDAGQVKRIVVTLDARADTAHPVYSGLAARPALILRSPLETTSLPPLESLGEAELESYLGTRVRAGGRLESAWIALRGVQRKAIGQDEVRSERMLAKLAGTNVWALSPTFAGEPSNRPWLEQTQFEGVLTRLADIGSNTETFTLEWDFEEIQRVASETLSASIDASTFLLIEGLTEKSPEAFALPVEGAGLALLVRPFSVGQPLPPWARSGPISGVLWCWDSDPKRFEHVARALGTPVPGRYGVIDIHDDARELNRKTTFGLKLFLGLGSGLLLLAAIGFWRSRRS